MIKILFILPLPNMPTIQKICADFKSDCKTVWIEDVTGVVSPDNINGWGLPNTGLTQTEMLIQAVTLGASTVLDVVSSATIVAGDLIFLNGFLGVDSPLLNGQSFVVLSTTATSVTIDVATSGTITIGILTILGYNNITSAVLNSYYYDSATDSFVQGTVTNIDVSSILPNISGVPFVITANLLGYGDILPDNIYYFTVTYTIGGVQYVAEAYKTQSCGVRCCYQKKATDSDCCGGCGEELAKIRALIDALDNDCCGNFLSTSITLKKLKKLCADCDCGCS